MGMSARIRQCFSLSKALREFKSHFHGAIATRASISMKSSRATVAVKVSLKGVAGLRFGRKSSWLLRLNSIQQSTSSRKLACHGNDSAHNFCVVTSLVSVANDKYDNLQQDPAVGA